MKLTIKKVCKECGNFYCNCKERKAKVEELLKYKKQLEDATNKAFEQKEKEEENDNGMV